MIRPRILVIAGIIIVLALHPWTWPAHGTGDLFVPLVTLAIVAVVAVLCAIKLGDLRVPKRRPRRPHVRLVKSPPPRTADDVTRAAEAILRSTQRPKR
ncbi:MAG TPA: hypothetical protein VMD91_16570 [Candidatus Sulfotelmatobacter sp.]|nr:hypothetical protein [Candidatus Sulfotelmatobacter sp.]